MPLPPPVTAALVTVTSAQVESIKVATGKKAKQETAVVLDFSGALNPAAATDANGYELAAIIRVKATGKGKNRKPAGAKLGAPSTPISAVYTAPNDSVTLVPRVKLSPSKLMELIVDAALVTDSLGRPIDGNDTGQPGGDYIATISGNRVTVGGLPLV
jgi:hypothetical protein